MRPDGGSRWSLRVAPLDPTWGEALREGVNMSIVEILKIVAALGTIATGLVSLVLPLAVRDFTGLEVRGTRGITEIRAVLGGVFIGLGASPFVLDSPIAYQTLGLMYLFVAVVRSVSMFIDRSIMGSNLMSVAFEVVFGVILIY
jgi:hypothetical protein